MHKEVLRGVAKRLAYQGISSRNTTTRSGQGGEKSGCVEIPPAKALFSRLCEGGVRKDYANDSVLKLKRSKPSSIRSVKVRKDDANDSVLKPRNYFHVTPEWIK